MDTLKNLRLKIGWTQAQLAEEICSTQAMICNYENGTMLPDMELMILLEKKFNQRITWKESLTSSKKLQTLKALIELSERYPLESVLEFSARMFRREKPSADLLIQHYSNVASDIPPEPMLPSEININH